MPKRIVDAHCKDGTVRSYRIGLRPSEMRFTDGEYVGIAKQYHVEDGLLLETIDRWVIRPLNESDAPKAANSIQS
ncbi:hypothetical protein [Tardiphaga sp.]|uniref:hypothetical protein n=1 Tax=Tardiphaga sp. TaxID=1926292 RepID=UPI00352BB49D